MRQTLTVLDFGTSKIVALVAETSGRQRCDIIGAGTAPYDGFMNRQWNDPASLNEAIATAVHEAEEQSRISKIREIQVGISELILNYLREHETVEIPPEHPYRVILP